MCDFWNIQSIYFFNKTVIKFGFIAHMLLMHGNFFHKHIQDQMDHDFCSLFSLALKNSFYEIENYDIY